MHIRQWIKNISNKKKLIELENKINLSTDHLTEN